MHSESGHTLWHSLVSISNSVVWVYKLHHVLKRFGLVSRETHQTITLEDSLRYKPVSLCSWASEHSYLEMAVGSLYTWDRYRIWIRTGVTICERLDLEPTKYWAWDMNSTSKARERRRLAWEPTDTCSFCVTQANLRKMIQKVHADCASLNWRIFYVEDPTRRILCGPWFLFDSLFYRPPTQIERDFFLSCCHPWQYK